MDTSKQPVGSQPIPPNPHGTPFLRVLALLIFAILIAVLSSLGTYWYLSNQMAKQGSQQAVQTPPVAPASMAPKNLTPTAPAEDTTVNIKELGISLTVPGSIKDLVYATRTIKGESYTGISADFSTKSLTSKDIGCANNGSAPPLGHLTRVEGQYPPNADITNSGGALIKQFPTFYIGYAHAQALCTDDQSIQTLVSLQDKAFHDSLSSIKELK